MYARIECLDKERKVVRKEDLGEHLVGVAKYAKLAIELLRFPNLSNQAMIAGALHDVGKALFNVIYSGYVRKIEMCEVEDSLSFRHHEVLSAAIYATYLWFRKDTIADEDRMIVRAILLHHQGLRGASASTYLEGLAELARLVNKAKDVEEIERKVKLLLNDVGDRLNANEIKEVGDFVAELGLPQVLEHARVTFDLIRIEQKVTEARALAGALMIADNAVAIKNAGDASDVRLYPREMLWFIEKSRPYNNT